MQIILERDSIDKPLTFNVCLLQLIFHTVCSSITYSCKDVFNHQILPRVCTLVLFIINAPQSADRSEGQGTVEMDGAGPSAMVVEKDVVGPSVRLSRSCQIFCLKCYSIILW